jgi:hypothetical protein
VSQERQDCSARRLGKFWGLAAEVKGNLDIVEVKLVELLAKAARQILRSSYQDRRATCQERKKSTASTAGQPRTLDKPKQESHTRQTHTDRERAEVNENGDTEHAATYYAAEVQNQQKCRTNQEKPRAARNMRITRRHTLIIGAVSVVHLEGHANRARRRSVHTVSAPQRSRQRAGQSLARRATMADRWIPNPQRARKGDGGRRDATPALLIIHAR